MPQQPKPDMNGLKTPSFFDKLVSLFWNSPRRWMLKSGRRKNTEQFWNWNRGLKPFRKLELPLYPFPPKALSLEIEPRIEIWVERGEIQMKNCEAGYLVVKGIASSLLNGWWLPKVDEKRKSILRSREQASTEIWVAQGEHLWIKIWCCHLEDETKEFLVYRKWDGVDSQGQRTLN